MLTKDGREVAIAAALAAAVNAASLVVAGIAIGLVALSGSPGVVRTIAALVTAVPAGLGAFVGARRAVGVLHRGLPAAATGLSGTLLVVIVLALAGNLGAAEAAAGTAIISPVIGALTGAWLGGVSRWVTGGPAHLS
ncbi:hypothetical protein BH23ACT9_BH23ACT9_10590 [soil metagenome]